MSIATLSNIEKTFGKQVLFEHLNLTIYQGERIGFVGLNGSGKTTLLRILTGEVLPDAGTMSISDSVKVGYLTQDPKFDPANTVIDEAELAFSQLHQLAHRLRDIEHAMADQSGETLEKTLRQYQSIQHEFDLAGGYVWHHRLEATLLGVGLGRETWEQTVETLSGGQRSRLALAKLLISGPDLLLLDEPTNHLDLDAVEWLENFLLDFKGAVVLISHDRFLLDRLATRIAWLNRFQISSFRGNYSAFVQQRELAELTQQRQYDRQQTDIEKQQEFIRRFGAGQRSKEAKGREKRLNRLLRSDEMVRQVQASKSIRLALGTDQRAGDQVLSARDLSKSYDGKVLWQSLSLNIQRGERIGMIGPNGSGKTTLLEVLLGRREADDGQIKWGANLNIGYYDQRLDEFDPTNTVIDEAWGDRDAKEQQVRDLLAALLFRGDDIHKPVGLLSGGERARVRLAQLLLEKPNVLLLDEPTNHLDIASCEALENALRQFAGTILCVSHDRYFLDKTIQRLLVLRPPELIDFAGNYSAWSRKVAEKERIAAQNRASESRAKVRDRQSKAAPRAGNPYTRPFGRLSVQELEEQIAQTERAIQEHQHLLASGEIFRRPQRGQQAQNDYHVLTQKLQELEAEYFGREN